MHIVTFQLHPCEQLPLTLGQAKASFPLANLTLIGNRSAASHLRERTRDKFPVDFVDMDELPSEQLEAFGCHYRHMHTSRYDFESICLKRWFYLKKWMDKMNVEDCVYLDSDVLLFPAAEARLFGPTKHETCAMVIVDGEKLGCRPGVSGHVSRWKRAALGPFCDFIVHSYQDDTERGRLEEEWRRHKLTNSNGGISDMTMLARFQHGRTDVENLFLPKGNTVFDDNLNSSEGNAGSEYEMRHGIKRITFVGEAPRLTLLGSPPVLMPAGALHFQGVAKFRMPEYYRGPKLYFPLLKTFRKNLKVRVKRMIDQVWPGSRHDMKTLETEIKECKKLIKELSRHIQVRNEKDSD